MSIEKMAPDEKLIRSGAAGFQKKLRLYNRKKIKNDPIELKPFSALYRTN